MRLTLQIIVALAVCLTLLFVLDTRPDYVVRSASSQQTSEPAPFAQRDQRPEPIPHDDSTVLKSAKLREAAERRMSNAVRELAQSGSSERIELILAYRSETGQQELERIEALGGVVLGRHTALKMMTIKIPADRLYQLNGTDAIKQSDLSAAVRVAAGKADLLTDHRSAEAPSNHQA